MNRREALRRLALLMGGAVVGPQALLRGDEPLRKEAASAFTTSEIALLDEIGETIIPATDTPGAKAVGIGAFMAMMVEECFSDQHQALFRSGLGKIAHACQTQYGKPFLECASDQRTALLTELDAEQRSHAETKTGEQPEHYFRLMKSLTLLGYFTSEVGSTQTLRYVEVPGAYQGDVRYKKGERAWFTLPPGSTSEF